MQNRNSKFIFHMTSHLPGLADNYNAIRLDLRTWPEVDNYLKVCKGVILPIGSTEQHGPTGAIGTDAIAANAVALEVGKRTGVLVAPPQSFGMAQHHINFPGTMSLMPSTLLCVVRDLILSLLNQGFEKIFVINGHGGNIATVKSAFSETYSAAINRNLPLASKLRCKLVNWFTTSNVLAESRKLYGSKEGQHATPSEISLTMHVEPSLIQNQRLLSDPAPSGPIYGPEDFSVRYTDGRMGSHPSLAKPEHGKILLDLAAKSLSNELSDFLEAV